MNRRTFAAAAALALVAVAAAWAQAPAGGPGQGGAQPPAVNPLPPIDPKTADAKAILVRSFGTYASARTYQADWAYTVERAGAKQQAIMEVRSVAPGRVLLHVAPPPGRKAAGAGDDVPEMLVVLDGSAAWFQNGADNTYFRIVLKKDTPISPLAVFPMVRAVDGAKRVADGQIDGKPVYVLQAKTPEGDTTTVEIDQATLHIRRMRKDSEFAGARVTSALVVTKEAFDKDIPDSTFVFKPAPGAREVPPVPGAGAMFGLPDSATGQPGKPN